MIKRYSQFIKESNQIPGPKNSESDSIQLTKDQEDIFNKEPKLQDLIANNTITLLSPNVWYKKDDKETLELLKSYLD